MAEIIEQKVSLAHGTVTAILKDELGVISNHTIAIDQANGKTVDELLAGFADERDQRVTKMLPHLEKLSEEHAKLVADIKNARKVKDAGKSGKA